MANDLRISFSERLGDMRQTKGLSQSELAKHIGKSKSVIQNYEANTTNPSIPALCALADYFNTSLDYLMGRTDCNIPLQNLDVPLVTIDGEQITSADIFNLLHSMPGEDIKKAVDYIRTLQAARANKKK